MAVETLKGGGVTAYDTIPTVFPTTGKGSPGRLRKQTDYATASAGASVGSTYRLARIPTNAVVKEVKLYSVAQGGSAAVDINVAFSDSTFDGTPVGLQGTIPQISSANNKLFGSATSLVSAVNADVTYANGFTFANRSDALYKALGYTADPGGYFDILLVVTGALTNGGVVGVDVNFVE